MRKISGTTKVITTLSSPVQFMTSPKMHNIAFEELGLDYVFVAFDITNEKIGEAVAALKTLNIRGASISMPNKTAVMKYLDHVDQEAQLCGAVNVVVNDNGILTGYNTDGIGADVALQSIGVDVKGSKIVLLGAGGAGKAIMTRLALAGAKEIAVMIRKKSMSKYNEFIKRIDNETGCILHIENLDDKTILKEVIADADILINATNVGMGEFEGKSLIPSEDYLKEDLVVFDVIYHPKKTKLLEQAEKVGCKVYSNGLMMLIYQGAAAFKLWTGENMPIDIVRKAIE